MTTNNNLGLSYVPLYEGLRVVASQFEDDFFVFASGIVSKHGETAAKLVSDTAIWGYKQIRTRKYYWLDKKKLLQRIIRSTNIALFQKAKEFDLPSSVQAHAICCIRGRNQLLVGCMGTASVIEQRLNGERRVMGWSVTGSKEDETPFGKVRYDIHPVVGNFPFIAGDVVMFALGDSAKQDVQTLDTYISRWKEHTDFMVRLKETEVAFLMYENNS